MQAELEKLALKLETESMISASYVRDGEDEYHQGQCDAYQRAAEIVRELAVEYAGLVLCDAEPVAWLHIQGDYTEANDWSLNEGQKQRGWEEKPLYAPADIGKEGGQ
jgi:hypothetical protein